MHHLAVIASIGPHEANLKLACTCAPDPLVNQTMPTAEALLEGAGIDALQDLAREHLKGATAAASKAAADEEAALEAARQANAKRDAIVEAKRTADRVAREKLLEDE